MKILILGSGLMGPAAAFYLTAQADVSQVIICDRDQEQLLAGVGRLQGKPGADKLGIVRLDLNNQAAAIELLEKFDLVIGALPPTISPLVVRTAWQAGTPLVDLAKPNLAALAQLETELDPPQAPLIIGCGLEPGLTEIMAHHLAAQLDTVEELHIKCGGIPAKPSPPLGYKIVFGGQELPLYEHDAELVEAGELTYAPRYSGIEAIDFAGVGVCEAWHEGFVPWLLDLPALEGLYTGTQKTVRWPGYAAKVTVLKELGLLSRTPVQVDGTSVVPKKLLDAVLYPQVKLAHQEPDLTLFRVEVVGQEQGQPYRLTAEMIDRYDPETEFTSMARTTAFTAAIVAYMLARGELTAGAGLHHPERLLTGPPLEQLLTALAAQDISFELSKETV